MVYDLLSKVFRVAVPLKTSLSPYWVISQDHGFHIDWEFNLIMTSICHIIGLYCNGVRIPLFYYKTRSFRSPGLCFSENSVESFLFQPCLQ